MYDYRLQERMTEDGIIVDKRDPDVLRVAPNPLYNSFGDVHALVEYLKKHLH